MRCSEKRQVFDGLRGITSRGCALQLKNRSKKWPAVAKKRETVRLAAAETERPMTPAHRGRAASKASQAAAYPTLLQFPPAANSGLPTKASEPWPFSSPEPGTIVLSKGHNRELLLP